MNRAKSTDGTPIAYDRQGSGPAVILVGGGLDDGTENAPLTYWPAMEAIAHTLAYDAACLGDGRPPAHRLARIGQPTLVATGGAHPPGAASWVVALDPAADAIAASIPRAERQTLEGQSHVADPKAVVAVLEPFFGGDR
jgi:pimeloyl-ACP methyl ester carboxylesterase